MTLRIVIAFVVGLALAQIASAQESPAAPEKPAEEKPAAAPAASPSSAPAKPSAQRTDRLDLDTTVVTGNRELPRVLYIVPWKKAELGELPAQPFNTLLDEVLAPVDREEFRREVKYYGTLANKEQAAAKEER